LTGARGELDALPASIDVVTAEHAARQSTLVVRTSGSVPHHVSAAEHVDLEDMVLAYMTQAADSAAGLPAPRTRTEPSEAPR
jgi:ABC-2 type transport system ATP-binding protein